jgi:hypothetical protein
LTSWPDELARDAGRARVLLAPDQRRQRDQEQRVGVRHVLGDEAVRVVLRDEAGVEVARLEVRMRQQADWNGMLLEMPRITKPLSASRILAIASALSLPCTMSLAIIES